MQSSLNIRTLWFRLRPEQIANTIPVMEAQPSRHPIPCRRSMLASLHVRVFLEPWTLTIRCGCGREHVASPPELGRTGLQDREERTLGKLVRRLTCQACGERPISVIAEHAPSGER